jgi:hypothetical protein
MNDQDKKRVKDFLDKWLGSEGNERANYQTFFGDFCVALGVEGPPPKGSVGGTGLNSLQSFIRSNQGNLKIFSNDGYVNIKDNEVRYETREIDFGGTLINIAFKYDESYYCLASEVQDTNEQWF